MVWHNLLKTAPNLSQASSVYNRLQQLRAQRKQLLQSVFGSDAGERGPHASNASPAANNRPPQG